MNLKKVDKRNLEFLTQEFQPADPIELRKNTNTYIIYDNIIKGVLYQQKGFRKQAFELKKYDPSVSIVQVLPLISRTKYVKLPKEDNLEEIMRQNSYEKIEELEGFQVFERKKAEAKWGILESFRLLKNFNLREQFKNYFKLWDEEPEFKFYEITRMISSASNGALLGAVMPSFWDYGGTLKLAGTLAAMQKIATPMTNVFSSGSMGKIVDKATGTTDIKDLKTLQRKVGTLYSLITLDTYLMQQSIVELTPSPETSLLVLFGIQTIAVTTGKMSLESKSFYAIRDYLIRKNPELSDPNYKEKFYQIIGTGQSLSNLCYAATFTPAWILCKSNPSLILPLATISAVTLIISKFMWGMKRKLKNPLTVKAKDFIKKNNSYIFDNGWKLTFEEESYLEPKLKGFQFPLLSKVNIQSQYPIQLKKIKENSLELLTKGGLIKFRTKKRYSLEKISESEYDLIPLF